MGNKHDIIILGEYTEYFEHPDKTWEESRRNHVSNRQYYDDGIRTIYVIPKGLDQKTIKLYDFDRDDILFIQDELHMEKRWKRAANNIYFTQGKRYWREKDGSAMFDDYEIDGYFDKETKINLAYGSNWISMPQYAMPKSQDAADLRTDIIPEKFDLKTVDGQKQLKKWLIEEGYLKAPKRRTSSIETKTSTSIAAKSTGLVYKKPALRACLLKKQPPVSLLCGVVD